MYLNSKQEIMSTVKTVKEIIDHFGSITSSEVDKAIALHDYVRENVKFGFNKYLDQDYPDYTLKIGYGHCNAKSRLMVVLLKGIGLEAYQHFVVLPKAILEGKAGNGRSWMIPNEISHSYVDVRVAGKWCAIDSFIIDTPYLEGAKARLAEESRPFGYGIHAGSVNIWDGKSDAFSQFDRKYMIEDHGRIEDLNAYIRSKKYRTKIKGIRLNTIFSLMGESGLSSVNSQLESMRNSAGITAPLP
jgi:hypothetical protein